MPKIAGRESTMVKLPLSNTLATSFLFPWDRNIEKRPCSIEGCKHKCNDLCGQRNGPGPSLVNTWRRHRTKHPPPVRVRM